jgi:endonuclease YncB( thermonuclease family)
LKSESSQNTMKFTSKHTVLALLPLVIMSCLVPVTHGSIQYENELTSVVNLVIDGDTFNVTAGETIRLADIDAPERDEAGYAAARSLLISLVANRIVYLDIDDVSRTDPYDRLVCVAFVDYNSTHVKNVNKDLLNEGVVTLFDHSNNEFNPDTWTLYVSRTMIVPEFSNMLILAVLLPVVTLLRILFRRRMRA